KDRALSRRCHQIQQAGGERFIGLDVYPEAEKLAPKSNSRNGYAGIMRERADDPCRPDRRAGRCFPESAFGMSDARQKLARDDARGAAGAPYLDDACGKRGSFLRHQSIFITDRDYAMADVDSWKAEIIESGLKRAICGSDHIRLWIDLFGCAERT